MITIEQWNNIKDYEKFVAINENGESIRFMKESSETVFEYAKGRRRYGYRYNANRFLEKYTLKVEKTTENEKWKKRLKKAILKMEKSGLWANILEKYRNLYKYVSLEEKERIYNEYWACDRYNRENGKQNYMSFVESVKQKYSFMIKTNENGEEYVDTDYIWELSQCKLKSMYFGKYRNEEIKQEIAKHIEEKQNYHKETTASYDITFNYDAEKNKAWYSEEYRNCGNGHYYLAIDENTAIFCEND